VLLDVFVNGVAVLEDAADEGFGKQARLGILGRGRRQFGGLTPLGGTFFIFNGRRLLGAPELSQLEFQVLRRVQIVLKKKLHGAFTRFTSFAHIA
jgi:hypothetical protein